MASTASERFILTPIDNIIPRVPVVKLLFFSSVPSISAVDTIAALRGGLGKTIQALPLIAGTTQVIPAASADEQQGKLCIAAPWRPLSEIFRVQDLSNDSTFDYASLRAGNFPLGKLPAATLAPTPVMADPSKKPVFFIQASLVNGGIIVAMGTSHSFTDGNGAATVAKVWAAYCKGDDGSRYLTEDVIDRGLLMQNDHEVGTPTIEDYPEVDFSPATARKMDPTTAAASDPKEHKQPDVYSEKGAKMPNNETIDNETFFFSKIKLAELKHKASPLDPSKDTGTLSWISTNDALCSLLALCVRSTSTATSPNSEDPIPLTIGIALNFRRLYNPPISSDYIGNAVHIVRFTLAPPTQSSAGLAPTSPVWPMLATSAHRLRSSINSFHASHVKRLITLLNDVNIVPDISKVAYLTRAPDGESLTVTSWAKQGFYECDFGERIGRVERVRMCSFAIPGLIVVAPERKGPAFEGKDEEGLEVMVGMERKKLEVLKDFPLIKHFATWIGKSCEHQEGDYQD